MYSEVHLAPEISLAIKQKLKEARDKDPRSAFSAIWDRVKKENPDLFAKLQAADNEANNPKPQPNRFSGAGQWSSNLGQPEKQYPDVRKMSLEEHKAMFALEKLSQIKLERPKKVEATHQEGFICVGGFSNPLF
jgi:hypothetical protein